MRYNFFKNCPQIGLLTLKYVVLILFKKLFKERTFDIIELLYSLTTSLSTTRCGGWGTLKVYFVIFHMFSSFKFPSCIRRLVDILKRRALLNLKSRLLLCCCKLLQPSHNGSQHWISTFEETYCHSWKFYKCSYILLLHSTVPMILLS